MADPKVDEKPPEKTPLLAYITGVQVMQGGVELKVFVGRTKAVPPQNLVLLPDNEKEAYHTALIAYLKREIQIGVLKVGPAWIMPLEGETPEEAALRNEEAYWATFQEKRTPPESEER